MTKPRNNTEHQAARSLASKAAALAEAASDLADAPEPFEKTRERLIEQRVAVAARPRLRSGSRRARRRRVGASERVDIDRQRGGLGTIGKTS